MVRPTSHVSYSARIIRVYTYHMCHTCHNRHTCHTCHIYLTTLATFAILATVATLAILAILVTFATLAMRFIILGRFARPDALKGTLKLTLVACKPTFFLGTPHRTSPSYSLLPLFLLPLQAPSQLSPQAFLRRGRSLRRQ